MTAQICYKHVNRSCTEIHLLTYLQAEEELAEAAENGKTTSAVGNDTVSAGTLALAVVPPESQDGNLADTADLEAGGSGFENDFAMDASTPYEADVPLPTPSHR